MSILRVLSLLKNKGYKPGRLQRTYKNLTSAGISKAIDPLTANRAAWLIYLYGCSPQIRCSARYWISKHVHYFKQITANGDETPVQFIAKFLADPSARANIQAIAIDRKTECVVALDNENNFILNSKLTLHARHKSTEPDLIYFTRETLDEIAIMINESMEAHKQKLLN